MKFDFNTQALLAQINNLYSSAGSYGLYDLVYDQLKKDGHVIKYSQEIRDKLWNKAKKKFNEDNARIIKTWPEDNLKQLLNKYFKSELAAKYCMDKVESKGCMIISDEHGKQIKFLNIVGYGQNTK